LTWRPDGWGWRARIGALVPHADLNPESELTAMAPPGVSIHGARVRFGAMERGVELDEDIELGPVRAFAEPPLLDDAAELLAAAPLDAIVHAFTSNAYVGGAGDEPALGERLERRTHGIPVVTTSLAALAGLAALGAGRLALVTPPWFSPELDQMGAAWFRRHGVDVVASGPADLPGGQYDIQPGTLFRWIRATVPAEADGVFIGGNGFRAVGIIEALEEDLGRPVLTANQVLLWAALHRAGAKVHVTGYGRLFGVTPAA
jgi:maleate isomerase